MNVKTINTSHNNYLVKYTINLVKYTINDFQTNYNKK